jgi:predicted TIM-barrel fold metal-dependent hydrolase
MTGNHHKRTDGTISVDFQGLSPSALSVKTLGAAAGDHAAPGCPVIDACVHARPSVGELQTYLPDLWRGRRLPGGERYYYPNPLGDYLKDSYGESGPPGSDPALVRRQVFEDMGVDTAILLPLTLGLLPDLDLRAAICSATNQWLADKWLTQNNADGRFKGSIRVSPADPRSAVKEIEKWAGHPHFVQIAVPMQSNQLYGDRIFLPVWEAAAHHNLPVAIHLDAESGVEPAPTPGGYLRHYLGYAVYQPVTFFSHLINMMAAGVLDHLPSLKLVFADGGWDMCAPFMWRLDKDYRPMRGDMPWMKRLPSDYIANHVRFVAHDLEGPDDDGQLREWLAISDASHILMFGSSYPNWNLLHPNAAFAQADDVLRRRILAGTAAELYRLPIEATPALETAR